MSAGDDITSAPVENLVARLHAKRNGVGWTAKCPAHDDRKPSLSINEGADGRVLLLCRAGCATDDVLAAAGLTKRDLFPVALRRPSRNGATSPSTPPFNWQECVAAFTDKHIVRLAKWRGYSVEFCHWLKENGLIGLYDGNLAIPVIQNGSVIGAHYRLKDGSWRYYPQGTKTRPLVIGELVSGDPVHCFESQWDAFAFMDVSGERDGVIVTRGASNGALVADVIPERATVYVWPQNDAPGQKWAKDVCAQTKCAVKSARTPSQFADVNVWTQGGATADALISAMATAETLREMETGPLNESVEREPRIRFFSPSELRDFVPDNNIVLVGDCHIMRGEVYVIAGPPGVGKSLAATQLAVSGAMQRDWFGLPVHCQFRTMIVQTENGRYRLQQEFSALDCDDLEDFIRISEPPPFGLTLTNEEFQEDIGAALDAFKPDCVIFDPWNAAARDDKQRDYVETFDALRDLLPTGADKPALGIVANTRKPQLNEKRTGGTGLMHLLAGSYILTSVPRCIFVMTRGTQDETDDSRCSG